MQPVETANFPPGDSVHDDYEAELSNYEKIRGKSMPSRNHSLIQIQLGAAFLRAKEYSVCSELTLEMPDGKRVVPDLCIYPRLTRDWLHDAVRMTTMPTLAIEIVLANQPYQDIIDKIDTYFANGVRSVWVVHPAMLAVAVYLPGENRPELVTAGEVKDPPTGLTVSVDEIFA